jgi:ATP-dependent DNA ligase
MMLGLHDHEGVLHNVGVCTSFSVQRRGELTEELAPYRENALENHPWRDWAEAEAHTKQRLPGAQSRWSAGKSMAWEPVRPELIVEVVYDQLQGTRFRHSARFVSWRHDRTPESCTYEQLIVAPAKELGEIFRSG